jgi:hypothetical protein
MPAIEIQASHLAYATVARAETVQGVEQQLVLVAERLDLRTAFAEGWMSRWPPRPPPPAEPSLQELIRTARERLRDDRVASDTRELDARKQAITLVRAGLGS